MRKKFGWIIFFTCFYLTVLAGCSKEKTKIDTDDLQETVINIFQQSTKETEKAPDGDEEESTDVYEQAASLGHGLENALVDENNENYVCYNGNVAQMDYFIEGTGVSNTGIGIMMYIDGMPQPYYTAEESDYAYMHVFYPEDNQKIHTTFYFIPVTGQAGDKLEIEVVSLWYPAFAPDMVNTFFFANFHSMLNYVSWIQYDATPDQADLYIKTEDILVDAEVKTEELTTEKKKYILGKNGGWTEDSLNTQAIAMLYIDDTDMYLLESYATDGKDKLHLRVEMIGCPLAEYDVIFYVNHEPVSCEGESAFAVQLSGGMISVVEADLDISDLEGVNVLYAVMVPKNKQTMNRGGNNIELIKSRSIALYNQSELPTE
jgi:hypothetical protein